MVQNEFSKKILAALKKRGIKVGKTVTVKIDEKRWTAIAKFCRAIEIAHKNTAKSKLNFKMARA